MSIVLDHPLSNSLLECAYFLNILHFFFYSKIPFTLQLPHRVFGTMDCPEVLRLVIQVADILEQFMTYKDGNLFWFNRICCKTIW